MNKNILLEKAKYYLFPSNGRYANFKKFPEDLTKFPIIENSMYGTYALNGHHFKPFYHIQYILPILCKDLNIPYDINDFNLIEEFDGNADVSFLESKNKFTFDLYDLFDDKQYENVDSSFLRTCNVNDATLTKYHKLFCFPHRCGRIFNKTIETNRRLVVSCDSQMIPIMPVLACYFKEIWHLDNRGNKKIVENIDVDKISDVIIVGGFNNEEKYTITNLI